MGAALAAELKFGSDANVSALKIIWDQAKPGLREVNVLFNKNSARPGTKYPTTRHDRRVDTRKPRQAPIINRCAISRRTSPFQCISISAASSHVRLDKTITVQ
ncbi:hypothetical protein MGU_09143 [Metarhizium guizhouense ARSEF 977]|uniref:Uncharacterized protein n=1 Tax=Metarhizium guizhouense (strain ARSEF 977) TaxID=1276136 RepID=A0A0B4H1H1_METGA|nr:hypothetical protein MGU_09143 [Metarhizium guizhouense ARSEF 977]